MELRLDRSGDAAAPRHEPGTRADHVSPGRAMILTAMTNGVGVVLALATSAILARMLGPVGRGEYAVILAWGSTIVTCGHLGLNYAIPCHVASSFERSRAIAGSGLLIAIAATAAVSAGAWASLPLLLSAQTQQTIDVARRVVPALALTMAGSGAVVAVLQGMGRFAAWNAIRVSQKVGWLGLLICCAALGLNTASAYATASAASYLLVLPVAALLITRWTKPGPWIDRRTCRDLLGYALPSWVASLPLLLSRRLDQLVLGAFAAPDVLGLYAVAASVASLLGTLVAAVANVAIPHLAGIVALEERKRLATKYVRMTVLVTASSGAVLCLGTPVMIPLFFGRQFYPAIPVAFVLIIAAVADGVSRVTEDALVGLGSPRALLRAECLCCAVMAGCLAVTLRVSPLYGAAISATVGYTSAALAAVWECRALVGGGWWDYLAPRRADLAALASTAQDTLARIWA